MNINSISFLYSGALGALLGGLVSAWVSVRLNYTYQNKLLKKQLQFQQRLLEQQLSANEKSHKEHLEYIVKSANTEYTCGSNLITVMREQGERLCNSIENIIKK